MRSALNLHNPNMQGCTHHLLVYIVSMYVQYTSGVSSVTFIVLTVT